MNFRYLRSVDIFYRYWIELKFIISKLPALNVWYNFSFEEIKKSSSNGSLNSWLLLKPFEWDTNWDTVRSQFKLKIQLRQFKRKKRITKDIFNEKREFVAIFWVKTYSCEQNCNFNWFRFIFEWKQCSSTYFVYFWVFSILLFLRKWTDCD